MKKLKFKKTFEEIEREEKITELCAFIIALIFVGILALLLTLA